MSDRVQQPKSGSTSSNESSAAELGNSTENATEIIDELDAILDKIDEVLESNAEEFVKNYVQKGGE